MNMGLAPRPANEDLRAQTVVKTGLIDAPNPDLFQIYCVLQRISPGSKQPVSAFMMVK